MSRIPTPAQNTCKSAPNQEKNQKLKRAWRALLIASVPLVVNPALFGRLNHDVMRDFAPVSLLVAAPYVLVTHPALAVGTVKDFIAYARVRPREINYG